MSVDHGESSSSLSKRVVFTAVISSLKRKLRRRKKTQQMRAQEVTEDSSWIFNSIFYIWHQALKNIFVFRGFVSRREKHFQNPIDKQPGYEAAK